MRCTEVTLAVTQRGSGESARQPTEGRGERLLPALPSAEHAAPGWPLSLRECLLLAVALYSLSCAQLFMAPSTVARRAPLAMGFPRQEH